MMKIIDLGKSLENKSQRPGSFLRRRPPPVLKAKIPFVSLETRNWRLSCTKRLGIL